MAGALVGDGVSDMLEVEGLLGGDPKDVVLGKLAIRTPDSLAGEPEPSAGPGIAVVHDELALLVLDLGVVGGNALVGQPDV